MTGKAEPWVCPSCRDEPESYFGRLVFPDDPGDPACPSPAHKKEDGTFETVLLVPVASRPALDRNRVVPVQKEISANA